MPTFLKLNVDRKNKLYNAGDVINGSVTVKDPLRSSISVKGLVVRFLGVASTFQIQGPYSEISEESVLVNKEIELLPLDEEVRLTKETNEFRFQMHLPRNLSPTVLLSRYNHIKYSLIAEVPAGKFSRTPKVQKNIYIVLNVPEKHRSPTLVRVKADISADPDDVLVQYGDGGYPGKADDDSDDDSSYKPEDKVIASQKIQTYNTGGSHLLSLLPERSWGFSEIYSSKLHLDVEFPGPGIYTDQPLELNVISYVDGDLPPLCLVSLKVTLIQSTFISARGIENNERKQYTLFQLDGPMDLSTSVIQDFSDNIRENSTLPLDLIPNFREATFARSYTMNVSMQFYKGAPTDVVPSKRSVIHARQDVAIYGQLTPTGVLPSYSSLS